jgi:hypothetical protein
MAFSLALLNFPLTKVAGKLIAIFLRSTYCQCGEVYPSILTESRPAGLVMAGHRFLNQC